MDKETARDLRIALAAKQDGERDIEKMARESARRREEQASKGGK